MSNVSTHTEEFFHVTKTVFVERIVNERYAFCLGCEQCKERLKIRGDSWIRHCLHTRGLKHCRRIGRRERIAVYLDAHAHLLELREWQSEIFWIRAPYRHFSPREKTRAEKGEGHKRISSHLAGCTVKLRGSAYTVTMGSRERNMSAHRRKHRSQILHVRFKGGDINSCLPGKAGGDHESVFGRGHGELWKHNLVCAETSGGNSYVDECVVEFDGGPDL